MQEYSPRDLDRLEKWTNRNLMKFIEDTHKLLNLGRRTIQAKDRELGSSSLERELRVCCTAG